MRNLKTTTTYGLTITKEEKQRYYRAMEKMRKSSETNSDYMCEDCGELISGEERNGKCLAASARNALLTGNFN